jgi:hypothetical protein
MICLGRGIWKRVILMGFVKFLWVVRGMKKYVSGVKGCWLERLGVENEVERRQSEKGLGEIIFDGDGWGLEGVCFMWEKVTSDMDKDRFLTKFGGRLKEILAKSVYFFLLGCS